MFPLGEKQHSCRLSGFAFSEFRCIESWVRHAMRRRVSAWSRIRENIRYKRERTKLGKFLLDLNPLKKHYWRTEQNSSVEGLDGSNSSQARQVLLDLLFWLLSYGKKLVNLDFIRNRVHKSTFGLQKVECQTSTTEMLKTPPRPCCAVLYQTKLLRIFPIDPNELVDPHYIEILLMQKRRERMERGYAKW